MNGATIKNPRKVFSSSGSDLSARITTLENNEYEITYFESVSAASGTVTKPANSTILVDMFQGGVDAYVSTIVNGQPTGIFPETSGAAVVDVTSFDTAGAYVLTGTPSAFPVAIIYKIKIKALYYSNLVLANVLDMQDINPIIRYSGSTAGNYTGSSIPKASTQLLESGATGNDPQVIHGTPIYGLIGTTTTNLGFKQDAVGFNIDTLSVLNSANTKSFAVNGGFSYNNVNANSKTFDVPGAFSGAISWISNASGSFLSSACDTTTVKSRGTQTAGTKVFEIQRVENQTGPLTMVLFYTGFNSNPPANTGGIIDFALTGSSQANVASRALSISYIWENTQNNDTTDRDTAFVFSTMLNNTLTERFRISSYGILGTGSISLPYVAKTTTYTATSTDHTIDCTSGTFTVTLPASSGIAGRIYVIKNSGAGTITIDGNASETIDGATTQTLSVQYSSLMIQSDGTNWVVLAKN